MVCADAIVGWVCARIPGHQIHTQDEQAGTRDTYIIPCAPGLHAHPGHSIPAVGLPRLWLYIIRYWQPHQSIEAYIQELRGAGYGLYVER